MVRISIILCLVIVACFASVSAKEETNEKALSDEALLDRVEREAGERKVRRRKKKKSSAKKRRNRNRSSKRALKKRGNKTRKVMKGRKGTRKSNLCSRQSGTCNGDEDQCENETGCKWCTQIVPNECVPSNDCDEATCLVNIGTVMDYEGNQVGNFERQKKRIESFSDLMGKKGGKNSNFMNSTTYLETALGTDKNCSKGATGVADTAKDTYNTLQACSSSISGGCQVPTGTMNQTYLDDCLTKFTSVRTKNAECYGLVSGDSADLTAACACYAEALTLVEEVKTAKCSAKASFDDIKVAKDSCLGNFSTCKKAEDATVGLIHSCNGKTTPAPITSAPTTAAPTTAAPTTAAPTTAAPTTAAPTTAAQTTAAPTTAAPTTAAPTTAAPTTAAPTTAAPTTAAPTTAAPTTAAPTTTAAGSTAAGPTCQCGVEGNNRIVGGEETGINQYPWLVRVGMDGSTFCGGTIVASRYVISAAHCFHQIDNSGIVTRVLTAQDIWLWIGDHDLAMTGETTLTEVQIRGLASLTLHPDGEYPNNVVGQQSVGSNFDIAILELKAEDALDLTKYTPACLAKASDRDTFDNQLATVAGWGLLTEGGAFPDPFEPRDVELTVRPVAVCPGLNADGTEVSPSDVCAAVDGGGKDSCQSDSGGPLTFKQSNGQHVLIGDVSRGVGCARPGENGIYGRISFFRNWIGEKMTNPTFCGGTADAGSR